MDDPTTVGVTEGFGLMFYNARWYDPALGRFAQADTIVPAGVQGLDRYAYVGNNPINYNDPSGHVHCDEEGNCFGGNPWENKPNQGGLPNGKGGDDDKNDEGSEDNKTNDDWCFANPDGGFGCRIYLSVEERNEINNLLFINELVSVGKWAGIGALITGGISFGIGSLAGGPEVGAAIGIFGAVIGGIVGAVKGYEEALEYSNVRSEINEAVNFQKPRDGGEVYVDLARDAGGSDIFLKGTGDPIVVSEGAIEVLISVLGENYRPPGYQD
jgi:RHS repeat-associated protein